MRKLIVLSFISLDGVVQSPGAPEEDPSGGFELGGWVVPFFDDFLGRVMGEQMSLPFDLLLGRKTFESFASYWPDHKEEGPGINAATKYIASTTMKEHPWQKSVFLRQDIPGAVSSLKLEGGPDLQVHGSASLVQTLLKHDLVDELWLKTFPVVLGSGKRLFGEGIIPGGYRLFESSVSPAGVVIASYRRAGGVKTDTFE